MDAGRRGDGLRIACGAAARVCVAHALRAAACFFKNTAGAADANAQVFCSCGVHSFCRAFIVDVAGAHPPAPQSKAE